MALSSRLTAALDELAAAPSPERLAFSLHVEDPALPVEAALVIVERGDIDPSRVTLVSSVELLRLAALGYRVEQT